MVRGGCVRVTRRSASCLRRELRRTPGMLSTTSRQLKVFRGPFAPVPRPRVVRDRGDESSYPSGGRAGRGPPSHIPRIRNRGVSSLGGSGMQGNRNSFVFTSKLTPSRDAEAEHRPFAKDGWGLGRIARVVAKIRSYESVEDLCFYTREVDGGGLWRTAETRGGRAVARRVLHRPTSAN